MGGKISKPDYEKFDGPVVLNGGFCRTGTSSMALALERLVGGHVAHGGTHVVGGSDRLVRLWSEALVAKRKGDKQRALKAVREGTRGLAGLSDTPAPFIIPELLELYPDIKVVLVDRDPKKWAQSIDDTVKVATPWYMRMIVAIGPGARWFPIHFDYFNYFCDNLLREAGKEPVEGYIPEHLELYNQYVINLVPKEQLLIMKMKEGWEPLCKFLGKPIPDEPFPWVNDAEAAKKMGAQLFLKLGLMWVGLFTGIGLTVYAGMKFLPM